MANFSSSSHEEPAYFFWNATTYARWRSRVFTIFQPKRPRKCDEISPSIVGSLWLTLTSIFFLFSLFFFASLPGLSPFVIPDWKGSKILKNCFLFDQQIDQFTVTMSLLPFDIFTERIVYGCGGGNFLFPNQNEWTWHKWGSYRLVTIYISTIYPEDMRVSDVMAESFNISYDRTMEKRDKPMKNFSTRYHFSHSLLAWQPKHRYFGST